MFCGKCGSHNPDTSAFCQNCGNALKAVPTVAPEMTEAERKRYRLIGMAATGIFAVLVIALMFAIFFGNGASSPKALAKQLMNAFTKGDAAKIFELVHDKEIDYLLDESDMTRKELKAKLKEASEDLKDEIEDYEISYTIDKVEDPADNTVDRIKAYYKDNCNLKVKDVKRVIITVTRTSDDQSVSPMIPIFAVKIGNSWYLPVASINSIT